MLQKSLLALEISADVGGLALAAPGLTPDPRRPLFGSLTAPESTGPSLAPRSSGHSPVPRGPKGARQESFELHAKERERESGGRKTAGAGGEAAGARGTQSYCTPKRQPVLEGQPPGRLTVCFITLDCWALGQGSYFRQRS